MGLITIPAYTYIGQTQYPLKFALLCDDNLYNKCKELREQYSGWQQIYEVSDQAMMSAAGIVNSFFGVDVISSKFPCAVVKRGSEYPDYTVLLDMIHTVGFYPTIITNSSAAISQCVAVNNTPLGTRYLSIGIFSNTATSTDAMNITWGLHAEQQIMVTHGLTTGRVKITYNVLPSNVFDSNGKFDYEYVIEQGGIFQFEVEVFFTLQNMTDWVVNTVRINGISLINNNAETSVNVTKTILADFDYDGSLPQEDDINNPYGDKTSEEGGNDGTLPVTSLDSVQPAVIPGLPTVSVTDLGYITMYNPTAAQMKQLADYMWSSAFDLATYKKLFADPMESIIGLAIVPVSPSIGGTKNVKFGNIDSGIGMDYLSSNWVQVDCGSVNIERYVGCFMDASPYTKINIYLPGIGFRSLNADDISGGSIHVVYNMDVLTGACSCFIEHSSRGVLYTYNGSLICNVPLTASNFSGAIQNAVSAVISGIGVAAGMVTGAAPLTAMSGAALLNSAANTALNSKPQIQRSGSMGGAAGLMSIMTPYVIIERPKMSVPNNIEKYVGQTTNISYQLGSLSGFTLIEYVHIEDCPGTAEEVAEIESLLKQGVFL